MNKLDLIIVGAQKAGTTSLNNYLRSHPDVVSHAAVEFSFFSDEKEYVKGFDHAFATHFDEKETYKRVIAKNVTISLKEESLTRLKDHNPDVKIVFLMREPVSRAYSAYTMAVKDGWMKRPFSEFHEILDQEQYDDIMYRHFIGHGLYARQLRTLLKYFPSDNIRLYLFEDLKQNPQFICNNIFDWLGLPGVPVENQVHNPTYKPRSEKLAGFIGALRNENNPVKRFVKSVLPYSLFTRIGERIVGLNKSNKRFDAMSPEIRQKMVAHFCPFQKDLTDTLDKDKLDASLYTQTKDTWVVRPGQTENTSQNFS